MPAFSDTLQPQLVTGLSARVMVCVVDCVSSSTDTCVKHNGVHGNFDVLPIEHNSVTLNMLCVYVQIGQT